MGGLDGGPRIVAAGDGSPGGSAHHRSKALETGLAWIDRGAVNTYGWRRTVNHTAGAIAASLAISSTVQDFTMIRSLECERINCITMRMRGNL